MSATFVDLDWPDVAGPLRDDEPLIFTLDVGYGLPPVELRHYPDQRAISPGLFHRALQRLIELSAEKERWYIFAGLAALARLFGCSQRHAEELMRRLEEQGLVHRERRRQGWRYYITWLTLPGMTQPFKRARAAGEELRDAHAGGVRPNVQTEALVMIERLPEEQRELVEEWLWLRTRTYPDAPPAKTWHLPAPALFLQLQKLTLEAAQQVDLPVSLAIREVMRIFFAQTGLGDGKLQELCHPLSWIARYLFKRDQGPSIADQMEAWVLRERREAVRKREADEQAEADQRAEAEALHPLEQKEANMFGASGAIDAIYGARSRPEPTTHQRLHARQLALEGRGPRAPGSPAPANVQKKRLAAWMADNDC